MECVNGEVPTGFCVVEVRGVSENHISDEVEIMVRWVLSNDSRMSQLKYSIQKICSVNMAVGEEHQVESERKCVCVFVCVCKGGKNFCSNVRSCWVKCGEFWIISMIIVSWEQMHLTLSLPQGQAMHSTLLRCSKGGGRRVMGTCKWDGGGGIRLGTSGGMLAHSSHKHTGNLLNSMDKGSDKRMDVLQLRV